jgi:hypothetical protein
MYDKFNNPIPFYDVDAYATTIAAELADGGIFYDNYRCRRYTLEYEIRLICTFEPL